jgi:hypothetical protein
VSTSPVRRSDVLEGPFGGIVAATTGVALLGYAYVSHGCTQVGCARDTGLAFQRVSVADWAVYWQDSCNSCGTDLTPVLAGAALLVLGAFWLSRTAWTASVQRFDDPG